MLKRATCPFLRVGITDLKIRSAPKSERKWFSFSGSNTCSRYPLPGDNDFTPKKETTHLLGTNLGHLERKISRSLSRRLSYKCSKRSSNLVVVDETPENSFEDFSSDGSNPPSEMGSIGECDRILYSDDRRQGIYTTAKPRLLVDNSIQNLKHDNPPQTKKWEAQNQFLKLQPVGNLEEATPESQRFDDVLCPPRKFEKVLRSNVHQKEKKKNQRKVSRGRIRSDIASKPANIYEFIPRATSTPAVTETAIAPPRRRIKARQGGSIRMLDSATQTTPRILRRSPCHQERSPGCRATASGSTSCSSPCKEAIHSQETDDYEYALFITPKAISHKISASDVARRKRKKLTTKTYQKKRKKKTKDELLYQKFIDEMAAHYKEIEEYELCIERV